VQFLKARKQLADRLQQEEIIKQRDSSKTLAESAVGEIKSLNDTQASIMRNKVVLEAERNRLLQELNRVNCRSRSFPDSTGHRQTQRR